MERGPWTRTTPNRMLSVFCTNSFHFCFSCSDLTIAAIMMCFFGYASNDSSDVRRFMRYVKQTKIVADDCGQYTIIKASCLHRDPKSAGSSEGFVMR